jgi:hypothetical protein
MPTIDRQSWTAESAPSSAAFATASRVPLVIPNIRETTTIPVQIHAIAMARSLLTNEWVKKNY